MIKPTSVATALAAAAALLLFLPATPAQAQSPVCDRAIEFVNTTVDMSGGTMDAAAATALSDRLNGLAIVAQGEEKAVITAYANALVDDNITDLNPYTAELNRVCGRP
ncbi:hypothetical protein [Nocardia sp. NPDC024068]|uniref:hypothetical protein n=1 Tax=Nocardia sp. NPDC024068 TaxID=3157197 RepID=UPI0033EF0E1B